MVKHDVLVQGVRLTGETQKPPVILQMHDDAFPARFLTDLAAPDKPSTSMAISVDQVTPAQPPPVLFQPVQRMVHLAMVQLSCETPGYPMVDPKRVESAGIVIRQVNGATNRAWVRSPRGQYQWLSLTPRQESLDPDPTKRPQLYSGQPELDRQLAALSLSTANTEVSTPAFVAPPDICAALGRTVVYALIPTASSEVSDASPPPRLVPDRSTLASSLPPLLQEGAHNAGSLFPPVPSRPDVDYRWMSDDYLLTLFPIGTGGKVPDEVRQFQMFATALRMLHNVFGAFDKEDNDILKALNEHYVYFVSTASNPIQNLPPGAVVPLGMGTFYQSAKAVLLDYNGYGASGQPPTLTMPYAWDGFSQEDEDRLLDALMAALMPRAQSVATPAGRYQNRWSQYRLRMFFRIKAETPGCTAELVWSQYSEPFRIASWFESSDRPHPPIPLPDPTRDFISGAKPNCSFHVPGGLMGAMQGTTMSGLMKGSGGGPALNLDWICGFNIPLITICAFFVLNIFLMLLNIVFFWLPFIKICIPFPVDSGQD